MTDSPFMDKSAPPGAGDLSAALGRSAALWDRLRADLAADHSPLTETWKFYRHWTLQVRRRKRTVAWMTPRPKHFLVSMAYGERAAAAARASDLPEETKALIETAEKYAEGRAVRIEVRYRRDADVVRKVAAIRMAH